jgi:hypothetical protein
VFNLNQTLQCVCGNWLNQLRDVYSSNVSRARPVVGLVGKSFRSMVFPSIDTTRFGFPCASEKCD